MPEWKKINVNIQNVKHETEKALLIALPHSSDFDGFTFWVSKKLVRPGMHDYLLTLSVHDEMEFNLKRTSDKTHAVLEEKTISAVALIDAFEGRS